MSLSSILTGLLAKGDKKNLRAQREKAEQDVRRSEKTRERQFAEKAASQMAPRRK